MDTNAKNYDVTKYDRPSVTVDVLLFTIDDGELKLLLIKRTEWPFENMMALPGGFVKMDESLDEAANRELREESGIKNVYLEQLYTFGAPKRDPRTRVITVTFLALVESGKVDTGMFYPVDSLPKLAFDHNKIVEYGVGRLRNKLMYSNIAFGLLPREFSLTDLQTTYEIVLGKELDKRNFRKKILSVDLLSPTGEQQVRGAHRPAKLYRFRSGEIEFF